MVKFIRYSSLLLSISIGIMAALFKSFNLGIIALMLLWLNNVIYCAENMKQRMFVFVFHITIFVFLLSRPFISMLNGQVWWKEHGVQNVYFSMLAISFSLYAFFLGALFANAVQSRSESCRTACGPEREYKEIFARNIRIVALIIFYISMFFTLVLEVEKLHFMAGKTYLEYYTSYQSSAPYIVYVIASFMKYSFCIYLATFPKKKECFLPLVLYVVSAVPNLIIGLRNPIMLNGLFVVLYYCIRNVVDNKEKWIALKEKILLILGIPGTLVFMSAYSFIRSGNAVSNFTKSLWQLFVKFFYGQGVSFDVLAIGYSTIPLLPNRQFRNYTFGGIIDYFLHGSIAQRFWGAKPLDSGNSVYNALVSNSFAHNMSYIAKGDRYLSGEGWGSSYLLETYTDFGYIGIIIFSLLLGILLMYGLKIIKKNTFSATVFLLILTQVFFSPRAEATGFMTFLFEAQFWVSMVVCYLGAGLCCKCYEERKKRYV